MCYTDRRSQLKLIQGGCAVAVASSLVFWLYTSACALSSDSVVAASLFIEQLTADANWLTPRIRLHRWAHTGELLVLFGLCFSAGLGILGASRKSRFHLKLFTGLMIVTAAAIFVLGLMMFMVVDAVGPVLNEQGIEYCAAPTYDMVLKSLGCKKGEPGLINGPRGKMVGIVRGGSL